MDQKPFSGRLHDSLFITGLKPKDTSWKGIAGFLKVIYNPAFFAILIINGAINFAGVASMSTIFLTVGFAIIFEYIQNEMFGMNPKHNQFGNDVFRRYPQNTYLIILLIQATSTAIMLMASGAVQTFVVASWPLTLAITTAFILIKSILIVIYMWTNMQEFTFPR